MKKFIIFSITLITLFLIVILGRPFNALYELAWDLPQFIKFNGDIESVEDSDSRLSISEIQSCIPFDSKVQYDSTHQYFSSYTRYHIYPINLEPLPSDQFSSDYYICNSEDFVKNDLYPHFKKLDSGHTLFSKVRFLNKNNHSFIWSVLSFVFFISVVYLLGFTLLNLFSINLRFKIIYSFLVGYTIVNSIQFIFLSVFSIHPTRILFLFYSLVIIFFGFKTKDALKTDIKLIFLYLKNIFTVLVRHEKKRSFWCFLIPSLGIFALFSLHIFITPVCSGDAIAFWMLKAKVLSNEGIQFSSIIQNEYPIFWPQFNSIIFDLQGSLYDYPVKWLVFVLLINLSITVFSVSSNASFSVRSLMLFLFLTFYAHAVVRSAFAETIFFLFTFFTASIFASKSEMKKNTHTILLTICFIGLVFSKMEGVYQFFIIAIAYQLFSKLEIKPLFHFGLMAVGYFFIQSLWSSFIAENGWDISDHFSEGLSIGKVKVWFRALLLTGHKAPLSVSVGFGLPIILLLFKQNSYFRRVELIFVTAALGTVLFSGISILGWETERIQAVSKSATARTILHAFPLLILFMYEALEQKNLLYNLIKKSKSL